MYPPLYDQCAHLATMTGKRFIHAAIELEEFTAGGCGVDGTAPSACGLEYGRMGRRLARDVVVAADLSAAFPALASSVTLLR